MRETTDNIVRRLCYEFQSVWIINIEDLSLRIFTCDESKSIPDSISKVKELNNYPASCRWYIEKNVSAQDQKRLSECTALDYLLPKIADGKPYLVEYNRINNGITNYNQLYYAKYEQDDMPMKNFILGFRDIDIRKKMERDDLTGVYTRQFFFQKAEQLLKRNPDTRYDLMLSDIVDFKNVNESYGSAMGDEILRWTGTHLAQNITDEVLVGRYGGDQFVLLCSHELMRIASNEEHLRGFSEEKVQNGLPRTVTKFGICEDVDHDASIISICDKAHVALNSIKHQYGKYVAYYNDSLQEELNAERKIESSMHDALKKEQFKVYYQPKHDTLTGALIGAEALIRWIHPEHGFMSPADFIPLFEKNGFIAKADYYVWERTCKNLKRWKDKGINVCPISVNASRLTFEQPDLIEQLQKFTSQNELSSSLIHLEITETLMTEDLDALVHKLDEIKSYGYQIELDDFGSGYSSFNILSTLPLDVVKLDISFMKQFGDIKRGKVLAACIKLAKELGYKTISEGVELEEHCDMLAIMGVDAIQGYFYSKPLPEDEFEKYMLEKGL